MIMFQEIPANSQSFSNRSLFYGVGINDASYSVYLKINNTRYTCPYYIVWCNMLRRCYGKSTQLINPTYLGCTVSEEWHTFSNFKLWMQQQDWKNKQLDKDLLIRGSKIYSSKTCMFVSQEINKLISDKTNSKGIYPKGVCFNKRLGTYQAQCCKNGKPIILGQYTSVEEAHKVYLQCKKQIIIESANNQTDPVLKQCLLNIANTEY